MKTKVCSKCGRELPLSEFTNERNSKDGLFKWCKECEKKYNEYYSHTLRGSSIKLWHMYVYADKEKGRISDKLPEDYIDIDWIIEQRLKGCAHQEECGTTDWHKIGINRLDNSKPHIKSNCEPCCAKCNRRLQDNAGKQRQVQQIDPKTKEVVAIYQKINDAAEAICGNHSHISNCCQGKRKTHKGYIWKYA